MILKKEHARLSKSVISYWTRGIHSPEGKLNQFVPKSTPELAYVIGVILGDGNLNIHGYNAEMILAVIDHDFAEEFSRCLARVLHRERPYKIRWTEKKGRWVVQGSSFLLYKFLHCDWRRLKPWIEHCDRCKGAFLRAFYDCEGSMSDSLVVYNTREELLCYIKKLLEHATIETNALHSLIMTGSKLRDPRNGRTYIRKKDCFYFTVRKRSLPKFAEYVRFTIERKSERLRDAALRVKQQHPGPPFRFHSIS